MRVRVTRVMRVRVTRVNEGEGEGLYLNSEAIRPCISKGTPFQYTVTRSAMSPPPPPPPPLPSVSVSMMAGTLDTKSAYCWTNCSRALPDVAVTTNTLPSFGANASTNGESDGGVSDTTTCAFVPPNPKELTPATLFEWPLGQVVASELTVTFRSLKSIELLSFEKPYVPNVRLTVS